MMRFNEDSSNDMKSISGGSIEEIDNFKYLGGKKAQAWMACHKLKKIWKFSMSRE